MRALLPSWRIYRQSAAVPYPPSTPTAPGWLGRAARLLFRVRGYSPLPLIALLLLGARITPLGAAIGGAMVAGGEAIRLWGVAHAGSATRTRTIGAPRLVTSGPYAHTRNPLYLGNLLMTAGFVVFANAWMPWSLVVILALFALQYGLIVREEEAHLGARFGEEYRAYRAEVPRFGVRLAPYRGGAGAPSPAAPARRWTAALGAACASEKRTFQTTLALLALLGLRGLAAARWPGR